MPLLVLPLLWFFGPFVVGSGGAAYLAHTLLGPDPIWLLIGAWIGALAVLILIWPISMRSVFSLWTDLNALVGLSKGQKELANQQFQDVQHDYNNWLKHD